MSNDIITIAPSNNAVVVALAADMFRDIDFTGISQAIENIANSNGVLTVEEKQTAASLVDQWERDVVDRLHDRHKELKAFNAFFTISEDGQSLLHSQHFEEMGLQLAETTNTEAEYDALLALLDELQDLKAHKPDKPLNHLDIDKTQKEIMDEDSAYRLALAKHDLAIQKKTREAYLAERDWKTKLKKNKDLRELIKKSSSFTRNFGKFTNLCHDKAQVAKLNIAIQDKNLRDSLKELLDFSATKI